MNQSRNRLPWNMTTGARYAVVFLFVLTLAIGATNLLFTATFVNRAAANKASIIQLCTLGNEARADQVTLWTRLVALSPPPPHQTAAEAQQRAHTISVFTTYVHQLFAPRNCQKVGNTP